MIKKLPNKFSLKFFRVIWEADDSEPELVPRVNRQLTRACERNRIKRILREFFRRHKKIFCNGRWVFIAKRQVEKVPNRQVFSDLEIHFQNISIGILWLYMRESEFSIEKEEKRKTDGGNSTYNDL